MPQPEDGKATEKKPKPYKTGKEEALKIDLAYFHAALKEAFPGMTFRQRILSLGFKSQAHMGQNLSGTSGIVKSKYGKYLVEVLGKQIKASEKE